MLSSLPGSAISSVKIDGVLHEFQTIEGVVEDVTTTGNSLIKAINAIKDNYGIVKRAFVVVDRCEGAKENFNEVGVQLEPLISIDEFLEN